MRKIRFRIFLAVAWFLWIGVIVPSHTRGAIPVAGSVGATPAGHDCCGPATSTCPTDQQKPNPANCAVCELTIKLSTPVTFTIDLRPAGRVEIAPPGELPVLYVCESPLVLTCRGPPVFLRA